MTLVEAPLQCCAVGCPVLVLLLGCLFRACQGLGGEWGGVGGIGGVDVSFSVCRRGGKEAA